MALASSTSGTGKIYDERPSLLRVLEQYLDKMLSCVEGLKVLLVDPDVRTTLNLITSHTGLLGHSVLLVDMLENPDRPDLRFMPCIVIARPTADVSRGLSSLLEEAKFKEYHLFFTNIVDTDMFQSIINSDVKSLVKTFEEVYLDILPIVDDTCLIRLPQERGSGGATAALAASNAKIPMGIAEWTQWDFTRVCQGLVATMLGSNRRPVIRYRNNSKVAAKIAQEVGNKMRMINTTFFDLRSRGSLLLILERCDDPITPLLTQWTYEAMVHEYFGIEDGVVQIADVQAGSNPTTDKANIDGKDVLTAQHDNFFASHRESDWGQLCTSVRDLIEAYKSLHSIDLATASLTDIKEFMSRFPEAKAQSTIMNRHATIIGRLGDIVMGGNLCDVSTVEQELACGASAPNDHAKLVLDAIRQTIEEPTKTPSRSPPPEGEAAAAEAPAAAKPAQFAFKLDNVIRLVMLYAVRYDVQGKVALVDTNIAEMREALKARGATGSHMNLIDRYVQFGNAANRVCPGSLYPRSHFLKSMVKAISGFSGEVKNVLTQHNPLLKKLLSQAYNGTLPTDQYPIHTVSQGAASATTRFTDIIVFIAGGATYEESLFVSRVNQGKIDNDPTTFPQGAEIVAKDDAAEKRVDAADFSKAAAAAGGAVLNVGRAAATTFARLATVGNNANEEPDMLSPTRGGSVGPAAVTVTKTLDCHVTLVANGMLRTGEFLKQVVQI
jgi:vacuolar protein sorting-associated protein 45